MRQFNFDLQRFDNINSIEITATDDNAVVITPYNNTDGFAVIKEQKIYFSGNNRHNRFGFAKSDNNTERNLLYRSKVTDSDKSVIAAAMDRSSTVVITSDNKMYVTGKTNASGSMYKPLKSRTNTTETWVELPHAIPDKLINVYIGRYFMLVLTDKGSVYGLGMYKKYWLSNGSGNANSFTKLSDVSNVCKIAIGNKTVFLLTKTGNVKVLCDDNSIIRDKTTKKLKAYTDYTNLFPVENNAPAPKIIDMDCDGKRAVFVTNDNKVYACGYFGFDPWTKTSEKEYSSIAKCTIFANLNVKKARVYGWAIVVNDERGKVYIVGDNTNGRIDPNKSEKIITEPLLIGYPLDNHSHTTRDIKCFYNTSDKRSTIFFLCGCHKTKVWCYGLGFGSEFGKDKFLRDPDDLNMDPSYVYKDEVKIFGHDNALFVAKPDGVYAVGYNSVGELGTGNSENRQTILYKVFSEQVDKIAIGRFLCLIQTHGTVFAAGNIVGGAINSTTFVPVEFDDSKTVRVTDIDIADFSTLSSTPIIKRSNGKIYSAGINAYGFIDPDKSNGAKFKTFVEIPLSNKPPEIMFENGKKSGMFYKYPNSGANKNQIACIGVREFFTGNDSTSKEYEGNGIGNVVKSSTICRDGATDIVHVAFGNRPLTAVYTNSKGNVKIYTVDSKVAGLGKQTKPLLNENMGTSNYCIIDSDITNVKSTAVGDYFIAYLTNDGKVWITGKNRFLRTNDSPTDFSKFQLLDTRNSKNPVLENIVSIVAVKKGLVLLEKVKKDGKDKYNVLLHGFFEDGISCNGMLSSVVSLGKPILYLTSDIKENMLIEAGRHMSFFCICDSSGEKTYLYAVGHNESGGMGNGLDSDTKTLIGNNAWIQNAPNDIINIVSSNYTDHRTYLITKNGEVYATGKNGYGQLGLGNNTNVNTFQLVTFPTAYEDEVVIKKIAIGNSHTLFLSEGGYVYACGGIAYASIGNNYSTGSTVTRVLSPILIAGGDDDSTFNGTETMVDLAGETIIDIAAGDYFSILLTNSGVYCAGRNTDYALGDDSTNNSIKTNFSKNNSAKNVQAIFASNSNSYYYNESGYLYGAGSNSYKQLGRDDTSPIKKYTSLGITGLDRSTTLELGNEHGGYITRGMVPYMFGSNVNYRLGLDGNITSHKGVTLAVENAIAVKCGFTHSLVLTANGLVYSFGSNSYGQLGRSGTTQEARLSKYVFSVLPYPLLYVSDIEGDFNGANKQKYHYTLSFGIVNYDFDSIRYSVNLLVGTKKDSEEDVEYVYRDNSAPETCIFTRYNLDTAEDVLKNEGMKLLGTSTNQNSAIYKISNSVYELDEIEPIVGYYVKNETNVYCYIIEATIGKYTPHRSDSVNVNITTRYKKVSSSTQADLNPSSYPNEFTDLGNVAKKVTVRGGKNCESDYNNIYTVMNQHKDTFIKWVYNIVLLSVDAPKSYSNYLTLTNPTPNIAKRTYYYETKAIIDDYDQRTNTSTTAKVITTYTYDNSAFNANFSGKKNYTFKERTGFTITGSSVSSDIEKLKTEITNQVNDFKTTINSLLTYNKIKLDDLTGYVYRSDLNACFYYIIDVEYEGFEPNSVDIVPAGESVTLSISTKYQLVESTYSANYKPKYNTEYGRKNSYTITSKNYQDKYDLAKAKQTEQKNALVSYINSFIYFENQTRTSYYYKSEFGTYYYKIETSTDTYDPYTQNRLVVRIKLTYDFVPNARYNSSYTPNYTRTIGSIADSSDYGDYTSVGIYRSTRVEDCERVTTYMNNLETAFKSAVDKNPLYFTNPPSSKRSSIKKGNGRFYYSINVEYPDYTLGLTTDMQVCIVLMYRLDKTSPNHDNNKFVELNDAYGGFSFVNIESKSEIEDKFKEIENIKTTKENDFKDYVENMVLLDFDTPESITGTVNKTHAGTYYYLISATARSYDQFTSTSVAVDVSVSYCFKKSSNSVIKSYTDAFNTNDNKSNTFTITKNNTAADLNKVTARMNECKTLFTNWVNSLPVLYVAPVNDITGYVYRSDFNHTYYYRIRANIETYDVLNSTSVKVNIATTYNGYGGPYESNKNPFYCAKFEPNDETPKFVIITRGTTNTTQEITDVMNRHKTAFENWVNGFLCVKVPDDKIGRIARSDLNRTFFYRIYPTISNYTPRVSTTASVSVQIKYCRLSGNVTINADQYVTKCAVPFKDLGDTILSFEFKNPNDTANSINNEIQGVMDECETRFKNWVSSFVSVTLPTNNPITGYIYREKVGTHYYKIEASFIGNYYFTNLSYQYQSVHVQVQTTYDLVDDDDYDSSYKPKYKKTYTDSAISQSIVITSNISNPTQVITNLMNQHKTSFENYVNNIPVSDEWVWVAVGDKFKLVHILGKELSVSPVTAQYRSNVSDLLFEYTMEGVFDPNNAKYRTSTSTEMKVNYTVSCLDAPDETVKFKYDGSRRAVFTYDNRDTVQSQFDRIKNNILNGTRENGKTIDGMINYLKTWFYIPPLEKDWFGFLSFTSNKTNIIYSFHKYARRNDQTVNKISYGIDFVSVSKEYANTYVSKRIMNVTYTQSDRTFGIEFDDTTKPTNDIGFRYLNIYNSTNSLMINVDTIKDYKDTITTNLNSMINFLEMNLNEVLGPIYMPENKATVNYTSTNGTTYEIRTSINLSDYVLFKDTSVDYTYTMEFKNPYTNKYVLKRTDTITITTSPDKKNNRHVKYTNYEEKLKSFLSFGLTRVRDYLNSVIGEVTVPLSIKHDFESTYEGHIYVKAIATLVGSYVPHVSTSVSYNITLKHGKSANNLNTEYKNIPVKTVKISGGGDFKTGQLNLTNALNAAINKFKTAHCPSKPTCPKTESEKNPYVHTITSDIAVQYLIKTEYSLKREKNYTYTCIAVTKYAVNNKKNPPFYTYRTNGIGISINSYTSFPANIKNKASTARTELKRLLDSYLSVKVGNLYPNAYKSNIRNFITITDNKEFFNFPEMQIYCENTQLSYDVKFTKDCNWSGPEPARSTKLKTTLSIHYKQNNNWIKFDDGVTIETTISNASTHLARLNTTASDLLIKLDSLLSTFIGPITLPDVEYQEYNSKTGAVYYMRYKFTIKDTGTNYSKRSVLIEEEWDNVPDFSNKKGKCKFTSTIDVTASNYANHTVSIRNAASEMRTKNKTWLDTLVPPVEVYSDYDNRISVAKTGTTYAYWITFNIEKNTDYTENGKAQISYTTTWKDESDSKMSERTYGNKRTLNITKDNYLGRKQKIDELRASIISDLTKYLNSLVPPLEDQEDIDLVYESEVTKFSYNITTKFNITQNSDYVKNGKILVTVTSTWTSAKDNEFTDKTVKRVKDIEINLNNYNNRSVILRETNATNGTIKQMKAYLDTLIPPIETEWFDVLETGEKHRCSNTDKLYFINTQYTITKNSNYTTRNATLQITAYWGIKTSSVKNLTNDSSTIHTVTIKNYTTRYDDIMNKGEAVRNKVIAYLDKVLPTITGVPVNDVEYETYTCSLTKTTYYIKTQYAITKKNKNYTYNGSATFKAVVTWNIDGSTKYNRTWDASKDKNDTVTITYLNYNKMDEEILEVGENVRTSLKAYLDTLLPPINNVPDRKYIYVSPVTLIPYYKLVDYTIKTQSNYNVNGKAVITVTPKWGIDINSYPNTVSTLKKTLDITLNNYINHETLASELLKSTERELESHLDTLLGPISQIPDYIGDYKVSSTNGLSFKVKVSYNNDSYSEYEQNGTHNITLEAKWWVRQTGVKYHAEKFTVPDSYKTVTISLANYSNYQSIVESKGLELVKYIEKYLDTLIGKIIKPKETVYKYTSTTTYLDYYLKTRYEIEEYDEYGVYNDPTVEGKYVSVTVTTVCGTTKNFEFGEYVDFSSYADSDYWYDKEVRIYNRNFPDHTDVLAKFGQIQREQIQKKLDTRIGGVVLPGEPDPADSNSSNEIIPVYTADSTDIKYYIKTKYTILHDESDEYDNIKIATYWSKYTDRLIDGDVSYSRAYPDHLSSGNASTYDIYKITATNYLNHTDQLRDLGEYQRSHKDIVTYTGTSTGLVQYLETLIGIVVQKSSGKYKTLTNREIKKSLLKYCILIPDDIVSTYDTQSGKKFYLKTAYSYGGNTTASGFSEDTDEKACTINYVTTYSPNKDYSSSTTYNTSSHTITVENFRTRDDDLDLCSAKDFTNMIPIFGMWDVEVPSRELHVYTNLGGIVYYIQIEYTQSTTTNTSNSIKYKISYSRNKKMNNPISFGPCTYLTGQEGYYLKKPSSNDYIVLDQEARDVTAGSNKIKKFNPFSYTINSNNYQGISDTEKAIMAEASNDRAVLEQYLYVPTVEPKETKSFVYTVNNLSYELSVTFSHIPDNVSDETGRNIIYIRKYIDDYQYGNTIVRKYTRTTEAAEKDMDNIYKNAVNELKALCNKSPKSQKRTVTKYSYSFQIISTYSKEAGNTEVTMTTKVDGLDFYSGAYKVLTRDVNVNEGLVTGLNDLVLNFETYALCLVEMVQDMPKNYTDSFIHPIETENMSILDVKYSKRAGSRYYYYTISCDGIVISSFNKVKTRLFDDGGIRFGAFDPKEVIETNTLNAISEIKSVLNVAHEYFPTQIINKDGLRFGFRYTLSKDSMSNTAILCIYVDEILLREYECVYAYNSLSTDRQRINDRINLDLIKIKKVTYCELTEDDTEIIEELGDDYEDEFITTSSPDIEQGSGDEVSGTNDKINTSIDAKAADETRLSFMSGVLANYNTSGFSYSYDIYFEKDPNDRTVTATFLFDNNVYKVYTHNVEINSYDNDINTINDTMIAHYNTLISMLKYSPKNNETTSYYIDGFDYTCGATYTKLSNSPEVIINILVDGIIEETISEVVRSHYGEDNQTSLALTPLDDINRIINKVETKIANTIATFKGLTRDLVVYSKNGFSFNLSTTYTKNITNHTITMKSFIDGNQYGNTITEELTKSSRMLIDDLTHSSITYHGRGLSAIENMKLVLADVPADVYESNISYQGFKFNAGIKYTKAKGSNDVYVTKMLDSRTLGDTSTLTFSVNSIDDIKVFGDNLLSDLKQYLSDYCPADREYNYVPTGSELPFMIRTKYRKAANSNDVYITTSLDNVTYGASSVNTFNIDNMSELSTDVDTKEGLLKAQLEKGPKNYNEEFVVKNCVFKLDIKYEKAQDNLRISTSIYLDDVRYGDVRTENFDVSNPKSVCEYPNQVLAELKSLLSDAIPEDIISTYSRGKYTFDMEILFSKSSGSDVITITYKIDSADVYSTSLSTGTLIGG